MVLDAYSVYRGDRDVTCCTILDSSGSGSAV